MYEEKFIQGIRNTTQPFPLHLSSLNFLDDRSGESASAGENGRISERRRRNKKRIGNNKKKNESGIRPVKETSSISLWIIGSMLFFKNENQQFPSNRKRYSFPRPLLDYFQIKDKF